MRRCLVCKKGTPACGAVIRGRVQLARGFVVRIERLSEADASGLIVGFVVQIKRYQRQKASCLIVSLLFLFELDLNLVCEGKGQRAPTTVLSCDSLDARVVAVHAARMHTRLYAVPKYTWRRLPAGIVRRPPVTHKGCQIRAAHAASPPAIEARAMPRHATARTCVLVLWICFILFLLASALRTFLRIASCRAEGEPRYRSVQVNSGRFGFGWGVGLRSRGIHGCPTERTRGEPREIKTNTHPEHIT